MLKNLFLLMRQRQFSLIKTLRNPSIICYKGSRFIRPKNSNINIKGKIYIGMPHNAFYKHSDNQTLIYMKENSIFNASNGVIIGANSRFHIEGTISIGEGSSFFANDKIACANKITIGENCAISWDVTIMDNDGHPVGNSDYIGEVQIGNHVWIGCKAIILKGAKIGNNCVIGAGSVVKGQFPDRCLIAGNPARIIKENIEDWV